MLRKLSYTCIQALLCTILLSFPAWADTSLDRQGDPIAVGAELWSGRLERIDPSENGISRVIINDSTYFIDSDTVIKNRQGSPVALSAFSAGDSLDFYAIDQHLTKIMPAAQQEEAPAQSQPASSEPTGQQGDTLHQEGGVWKN